MTSAEYHSWFPQGLVLEGPNLRLVPLQRDWLPTLVAQADRPRIWQYYFSMSGADTAKVEAFFLDLFHQQETHQMLALGVFHKPSGTLVGSSSFYELKPEHRNLEIGCTWLNDDWWGQGINEEMKYLMLAYAFERLPLIRVQFKAWIENKRSCQALEDLGAVREGVLRNHLIRADGAIRTSVYYSILAEEWPAVKASLEAKFPALATYHQAFSA